MASEIFVAAPPLPKERNELKMRGKEKKGESEKMKEKNECQRRAKAEKEESVRLHVPSIPQALAYLEGEHNRNSDSAAKSVTDRALFRTHLMYITRKTILSKAISQIGQSSWIL